MYVSIHFYSIFSIHFHLNFCCYCCGCDVINAYPSPEEDTSIRNPLSKAVYLKLERKKKQNEFIGATIFFLKLNFIFAKLCKKKVFLELWPKIMECHKLWSAQNCMLPGEATKPKQKQWKMLFFLVAKVFSCCVQIKWKNLYHFFRKLRRIYKGFFSVWNAQKIWKFKIKMHFWFALLVRYWLKFNDNQNPALLPLVLLLL